MSSAGTLLFVLSVLGCVHITPEAEVEAAVDEATALVAEEATSAMPAGSEAELEAVEPELVEAPAEPAVAEPAVVEPPCTAPGPGCACVDSAEGQDCFESYEATIEPLSDELRAAMTGVSWREGCPVHLDDLRHISLSHWNLEGERVVGELIVAASVAEAMVGIFEAIYAARFPVARMERVGLYGGSDGQSMAANNTSAFNCRVVGGTKTWSQHAYGAAIDINPIHNPWVRGTKVDPPEGAPYVDRSQVQPGMVVEGDAVVAAFDAAGWYWGGRWNSVKDYQHFSENGR